MKKLFVPTILLFALCLTPEVIAYDESDLISFHFIAEAEVKGGPSVDAEFTFPVAGTVVTSSVLKVRGKVTPSDAQATLIVNGESSVVEVSSGGNIEKVIGPLNEGENNISLKAKKGSNEKTVNLVLTFEPVVASPDSDITITNWEDSLTRITIPRGALSRKTKIWIDRVYEMSDKQIEGIEYKKGRTVQKTEPSIIYDFRNDQNNGLIFNIPVTITINYTSIDFEDEQNLAMFHWDGVQWVRMGGSIDSEAKAVTLKTRGASCYGIWQGTPLEHAINFVSAVPNPFTPTGTKHNQVVISFTPKPELENETPQLRIFDRNGNLVRSFDDTGAFSAVWDGRDEYGALMPTGVYIYQINLGNEHYNGGIVLVR